MQKMIDTEINLFCLSCGVVSESKRCEECSRVKNNTDRTRRRLERKLRVFNAYKKYETPECDCCAITDNRYFCMDHINGDGNIHRESFTPSGDGIYKELEDNGYPSGFRILCWNCNSTRRHNLFCPSEQHALLREISKRKNSGVYFEWKGTPLAVTSELISSL